MRAMMSQLVQGNDVNGQGVLFGGRLMQWIDVTGAIACRRHAGMDVVLAVADSMQFLAPAHLNDTVNLYAHVTWTGRTTIECCVESFAERLDGSLELVNKAFMLYVAVKDGEPADVPRFVPQDAQAESEYEAAELRQEARRARRQEPMNGNKKREN